MKHARSSTPRDLAIDMLSAMGARRGDVGGRHRAALVGDEWTPTSKLADRADEIHIPAPRHRAAS